MEELIKHWFVFIRGWEFLLIHSGKWVSSIF